MFTFILIITYRCLLLYIYFILQEKLSNLLEKSIVGSRAFQDIISHIRYEDELESSWKKHFPTEMPKAVILNDEWRETWSHFGRSFRNCLRDPFLESLQQFLSIRDVFESVIFELTQHFFMITNCMWFPTITTCCSQNWFIHFELKFLNNTKH